MILSRDDTKVVLVAWFLLMISAMSQTIRPSCQNKCGSVNIPYPFGTTENCCLNRNFYVACNTSHNPPKPFLWNVTKNIEILEVSLNGHLRIKSPVAYVCYDEKGVLVDSGNSFMTLQAFHFSYSQNKFIGIGCDTLSTINATIGKNYSAGGCFSLCSSVESSANGSWFGIGFCQTSIPKNILAYQARVLRSNLMHSDMNIPCAYSLLVEEDSFKFSTDDFIKLQKTKTATTVLDWAVGNQTCQEAKKNLTSYACQANSVCIDSDNGPGYLCRCLEGYVGNAYLHGGCQDIDECANPSLNDCSDICLNLPGSYNCSCPKSKSYEGDGRKGGSGCVSNLPHVVNQIVIGTGIGLMLLLIGSGWLFHVFRKRKMVRLTARYFKRNGGLMLQQQIANMEGSSERAKIFTATELKKASENFHESRIIGRGGYGTVYRGILPNDKVVAIKKSKLVDHSQIEQFINEVVVLSQINHRNVVKLLGCCLETEMPLLVYEFVNNGTLFDHIHNKNTTLPWVTRLRIAAETAGVLAYLHSAASIPVIHRDFKSTNILLDDKYTAKVSDFGTSRLVPRDKCQLTTLVQGTLGYLDPEYFQTSQLTEKSDVYSFGVVLAELLTGRRALSFDMPEEERNLALYFLSAVKDDCLFQIVEDCVSEGNSEQVKEVANIAQWCLRLRGEERPTMKEVAMELDSLRMMTTTTTWINAASNSTEYVIGERSGRTETTDYANCHYTTCAGHEDDTICNDVMSPLWDGRISWPVASDCYAERGKLVSQTFQDINLTTFQVSSNRNKFTVIGCDTLGVVVGIDSKGRNYTTGCVSLCNRLQDIETNGSCSGTGCYETSIPRGLSGFSYGSGSVVDFNLCGHAFLTDLVNFDKTTFPVGMDWVVKNQTCQEAMKKIGYKSTQLKEKQLQMGVQYSKLLLQLLLVAFFIAATKTEPPLSKPNCQQKCGNVIIPFPFGMTEACSLNTSFLITCHQNLSPPTPFLQNFYQISVLDISLEYGQLNISLPVARNCLINNLTGESVIEMNLGPFHLSSNQNKLIVFGADAAGLVYNLENASGILYPTIACMSVYAPAASAPDKSCSGTLCCETPIQQRLSEFFYESSTNIFRRNNTKRLESYPCGYTFLVKDGAYKFHITDIFNLSTNNKFPVVADWAVGTHTCQDAMKNASSYLCKSNYSECRDAEVGPGYHCKCYSGYRGNPYLSNGCQDVDECNEKTHNCTEGSICSNSPGIYSCSCLKGYEGDGKNNGTGCRPKVSSSRIIIIALTVSVSILTLLGGTFYMYWTSKKRNLIRLKEQYFQQNGGLLLQQVVRYSGSTEMTKIFTVEELSQATNNFDESMVLGQGGQGTVYKGILSNNRIVAIKMSRISNPNQVEHFINEMILLSQINHRNVVKLLGCCLETEVPLLVYEFVPNGTVYEHLHNQGQSLKLTWKTRLQIATETARALAYLHSATNAPIIHRDVKTANILLDHNLTAKVSDFGASRIIPLDQTQLTTLVLGTLGYLDPEYFHSSQLTEKSDVYSFGVVLVELLTGKKALSFERPEAHRNLAVHFHSSMQEGRLLNIVDSHIIDEANVEQLMDVANIANHCLRLKGEERPTMKDVAMELEGISVVEKHQWEKINLSSEETENFLKAIPSSSFSIVDGVNRRSINSGSNILNRISFSLSGGR
ncbi:uncharacterized protein LOC114410917 [Glycine soja]|nr:uncharacterized protein LOC114410917 [Glycine soja]